MHKLFSCYNFSSDEYSNIVLGFCSMWKEVDGSYWFRGRWYIIPEETAAGRQPHNLRRELYRANDFADIEVIYTLP